MTFMPTPSQTVGPVLPLRAALTPGGELVSPRRPGRRSASSGIVSTATGEPVADALIEIWQAEPRGALRASRGHARGAAARGRASGASAARGTDAEGGFEFVDRQAGRGARPGGAPQAPHIDVSVFARGVLKRIATRIYFPDEAEANDADPILASIEDPAERATLVARRGGRRRCASTSTCRATGRPCSLRSSGLFSGAVRPGRGRRGHLGSRLGAGDARLRGRAGRGPRPRPGSIPAEAAAAIAAACDAERFDPGRAGRRRRARPATRWSPLVARADARRRGEDAGPLRALGRHQPGRDGHAPRCSSRAARSTLIDADLGARRERRARGWPREHRDTPMAGPHAAPAGAADHLRPQGGRLAGRRARRPRAAGRGRRCRAPARRRRRHAGLARRRRAPRVLALARRATRARASRRCPGTPQRAPVAELGAALALAAGALEKIALDVVLLAQTEVGEVAEPAGGGRGGSSTLPHKRNPVGVRPRARVRASTSAAPPPCCSARWPASTSAPRAPGTSEWAPLRTRWR